MRVEASLADHACMDDDHLIGPGALAAQLAADDAPLDEHRFGARPTRRRLIDDPRQRWPWLAA